MAAEDLILNKRLKLGAAALNTLATASMTVGVLAPAAAFFYGIGTPTAPGWELLLGGGVWALLAGKLHTGAQHLIGLMRL